MTSDRSLELAVGRVLWIGILASSIFLGLGLVLTLVGSTGRIAPVLLKIGLLLLLATPAARVVVSVVDYALERDWLFVALTVIVLAELFASVLAAIYGFTL